MEKVQEYCGTLISKLSTRLLSMRITRVA